MIAGHEGDFPPDTDSSLQIAAAAPREFSRLAAVGELTRSIVAAAAALCNSGSGSDPVSCASVFPAAVYDVCEDVDGDHSSTGKQALAEYFKVNAALALNVTLTSSPRPCLSNTYWCNTRPTSSTTRS